MTPSTDTGADRERSLGLWTATGLVIASMIGAGVFTTSGFLLADLGSAQMVLLAWLVGGVQAGLGALCYGALARRIPESGGEYLFLSRTLHPSAGYLAGWVSLLVGFSAPLAAAAFAFGEYGLSLVDSLVPLFRGGADPSTTAPDPVLWRMAILTAGSVLILLFGGIHGQQVKRGARIQNWAVWIKVALILVLVGFALTRLDPAPAVAAAPSFSLPVFGVSLVWISFSYAGWNAAVYIGGEVRRPERYLPLSLLLGTGIVTLLYAALNAVFVWSAPIEELKGQLQIGRLAAEALGGPGLGRAASALIALALVTSASSLVMAGPRIYAQMARDGYLPRWLRAKENEPPRAAILAQVLLALAFLWSTTYDALLTAIGFTLMLSTAATVVGLVRLRLREGRNLPVPGWPVVPALFLAGVLAMALFSILRRPRESGYVLLAFAIGWAAWYIQSRSREAAPAASLPGDPPAAEES